MMISLELKEKRIDCQGIPTNYIDTGEGEPIVFIHNGGGFLQIWMKQIEYFQTKNRVIALDLPGFGLSGESSEEYSLMFYTRFLGAFLEKLDLKAVNLVGNCIGASIAINYKQENPGKVKSLTLMNICPGERLVRLKAIRYLLFRVRSNRIKKITGSLLKFFVTRTPLKNNFPRILFRDEPDRESVLFRIYEDKFKESRQTRSRVKLLLASDSFTLKSFLNNSSVTKDAMLLWGEENKVAGLKREGFYHRDMCGIKDFRIIKKSGHLLMYESPEETNRLIEYQINNNL